MAVQASAEADLAYLYSAEGQLIVAKHYYLPSVDYFARKYASSFSRIKLFTVDGIAGGWAAAQQAHFADGAIYDQLSKMKQVYCRVTAMRPLAARRGVKRAMVRLSTTARP